MSAQLRATSRIICGSAARSDWAISALTSSMPSMITSQATPPISSDLASALNSSASDWVENRRLMPAMGSSLSNLGPMAWVENSQPPSISGATSAASTSMPISGAIATSACIASRPAWVSMKEVSKAAARSKRRPWPSDARKWLPSGPAMAHRPATAVASRTKVTSSRERATLPSSRAFSRRRGEAGSVFSRSLSSAIHAPGEHRRTSPSRG